MRNRSVSVIRLMGKGNRHADRAEQDIIVTEPFGPRGFHLFLTFDQGGILSQVASCCPGNTARKTVRVVSRVTGGDCETLFSDFQIDGLSRGRFGPRTWPRSDKGAQFRCGCGQGFGIKISSPVKFDGRDTKGRGEGRDRQIWQGTGQDTFFSGVFCDNFARV